MCLLYILVCARVYKCALFDITDEGDRIRVGQVRNNDKSEQEQEKERKSSN